MPIGSAKRSPADSLLTDRFSWSTGRYLLPLISAGCLLFNASGLCLAEEKSDAGAGRTRQLTPHEAVTKLHHEYGGEFSSAKGLRFQKIVTGLPARIPVTPLEDPLPVPREKLLSSTMETTVRAPRSFVWKVLTDFPRYPRIFPRIDRVKVTKRQGKYVYTESILKKQLFVKKLKQKIVNDLTYGPYLLRWGLLEGNFKNAQGAWELSSVDNGKSCRVRYRLESTTGPIPKAIFGLTLKLVQRDIVNTFKESAESLYRAKLARVGTQIGEDR